MSRSICGQERLDKEYRSRLPRIEIDAQGAKWVISDGLRRTRLQDSIFEGEDLVRNKAGAVISERLEDRRRDGVDAELIFPNKGLFMWATSDAKFAQAQCRVWNDWAWETYAAYNDRMSPMACARDRRHRGDDRGNRARREARIPWPHDAVQAGVQFAGSARP